MTVIEFLFAVCVVADVVLHSLVLLALRDKLDTLILQGSKRRQWAKEEHTP